MKGKKIDFKDIKNSPYTSAVGLVLVMLLIVGVIVYFILGIFQTKDEIVITRESYKKNLQEIAVLEELRAQSEKAEAQLEIYKGILPDGLGDVYMLQEDVVATCKNFGLTVESVDVSQVPAQTQETIFVLNVKGTFENIHSYMTYISSLTQVHRFDSVNLMRENGDSYSATLSLAILSQNGAEGILGAVVNEAVAS